jgi:hypothetical protein
MATSRERQMKFIEDFGRDSLRTGLTEMLAFYGPDWLTDEQVLDIVRYKIDGWRRANRQTISNRAINKARIVGCQI